ncbi:MAG: hypothetical protein A3A97_03860 [Candidatus Terrybacteria bacterium RIFCSPLOWO2_01_FULL_40_23]|uniref:TrbC/VIRB2 family protein n=1 Tax=Candidatus Terrybacteria bacterium RIFCSPLOWO2_01_FULL_40_23 TaxID=1802366 RepID=A0A1G2PW10_9BACT|nr:MAG: hypothetical protein UT82_C0009G0005 [Parcubacteria group bacterium GW2011_GWB1_40_14]OHA52524.1 MAG: hypothetical protein A3A97_03860 [Candidatus Terrybacteria bacterium RIFCSPLOWO2_01_FULL_40_23]
MLPQGPDTFTEFIALICKAGNWFFTGVMAIALMMILVAAFYFLTGGGNPQNIEKAKQTLLYAIVGVIVAILPKAIIAIIGSLLGSGSINAC